MKEFSVFNFADKKYNASAYLAIGSFPKGTVEIINAYNLPALSLDDFLQIKTTNGKFISSKLCGPDAHESENIMMTLDSVDHLIELKQHYSICIVPYLIVGDEIDPETGFRKEYYGRVCGSTHRAAITTFQSKFEKDPIEEVSKIIVHEIGHTFGLKDHYEGECVMRTKIDVSKHGMIFCQSCLDLFAKEEKNKD